MHFPYLEETNMRTQMTNKPLKKQQHQYVMFLVHIFPESIRLESKGDILKFQRQRDNWMAFKK